MSRCSGGARRSFRWLLCVMWGAKYKKWQKAWAGARPADFLPENHSRIARNILNYISNRLDVIELSPLTIHQCTRKESSMSRFKRLTVLNSMVEVGVIPVFYNPDPELARGIISACRKGGARCVEFTNRGDHAFEVFSELERYFAKEDPEAILG